MTMLRNRRNATAVLALLLVFAPPAGLRAARLPTAPEDAFLAGQITAVLEREFGWARGTFRVEVNEGVATIVLSTSDPARRNVLEAADLGIDGLQGLQVEIRDDAAVGDESLRREIYSFLGVTENTVPFPAGDLFWPFLADPKQPQFFASFRYYESPVDTVNIAAVGYGETFGFYRRQGRRPGDGLQVSIAGGLFAQFNLDAPSSDLINADYTVGLPVTYRRGNESARVRLYHQSSHLGDEFLLSGNPERVNLSYESLEVLYSRDWGPWRLYGGGEYLLHTDPSDLNPGVLHGGIEYRSMRDRDTPGNWLGGVDLKSLEEHDWEVDVSVKFGYQFGAAQPGRRRLRILGEAYDGFSPHGQFYNTEISYLGIGVYVGF